MLRWLATSRIRDRALLMRLGAYKDPSDLYLDDPKHFKERWLATLAGAIPWTQYVIAEAQAKANNAWEICEALAREPDILKCFTEDLGKCGVVGEERAAKVLYLVFNSRNSDRPVSVAMKGASASGKSFLVEQILKFFPGSAAYVLSAMSERALAYSTEPLSHRYLVIYEAAGLQGDFASYLVRSLLSEGRIRYETVEKTNAGLRPRLIEREGPTGLIVTTTAVKLHSENETRLLSIPVTDTAEQTRSIFAALASGQHGQDLNLETWHALQQWLDNAEHDVFIPYAQHLAELVPPIAVRLRRDFMVLLSLIRAHAMLHQASRGRDSEGRIVATLDDYSQVRNLVADLLSDGIEATVSTTVRETVQAVKDIMAGGHEVVTVAQVASTLHLDKATALRRVRVAIDRGYLKNLEDRKGRPARLELGDPMPTDLEILPTPEKLGGCRVAVKMGGIVESPPPLGDDAKATNKPADIMEVA